MKSRFVSSTSRVRGISRGCRAAISARATTLPHLCNLNFPWSPGRVLKLGASINAPLVSAWCLLTLHSLIIFVLTLWQSLCQLFKIFGNSDGRKKLTWVTLLCCNCHRKECIHPCIARTRGISRKTLAAQDWIHLKHLCRRWSLFGINDQHLAD